MNEIEKYSKDLDTKLKESAKENWDKKWKFIPGEDKDENWSMFCLGFNNEGWKYFGRVGLIEHMLGIPITPPLCYWHNVFTNEYAVYVGKFVHPNDCPKYSIWDSPE